MDGVGVADDIVAGDPPMEELFDYGLQRVLDGVATQV